MDLVRLETAKQLMAKHDWFYEYSDDHRDFLRGHGERGKILHILRKLPACMASECLEMVPQELKMTWAIEFQQLREKK